MKPFFLFHLGILIIGVFALTVAVGTSFLYLLKYRELKSKKFGSWLQKFPSLEVLDVFSVRALIYGVVFLTLGNFSGIVIAHLKATPHWTSSTKFILGMGAWFWYLLLLFLRKRFGWRGAKFFVLVCLGYVIVLTIFLGSSLWNWWS